MPSAEAQLDQLLRARLGQLMAPFSNRPLNFQPTSSAETIQDAILEVAQRLDQSGWVIYIVGGTLRELLVGVDAHEDVHPRDVDIIVEGATGDQLARSLEGLLVLERLTRFGGLHLSRSLSSGGQVLFDIWRLEDTWGFHAQHIEPKIERFPATTFLNIDSCAMELIEPATRTRRLFEKGFFAAIAGRSLDINYEPNPYPHICAVRSLLIAARLNFTLSRRLAEFIAQHSSNGVQALLEAQRSHFGSVRAEAAELEGWLESVQSQLEAGSDSIRLIVLDARRKELEAFEAFDQSPNRRPA